MNKKFLIFGLIGIFAIGVVSAIGYYAMFSASFNVVSAISLSECSDVIEGEIYSGEIIEGSPCTITNNAPTEREISITNDADEDISVSYVSDLELTSKFVDFESDVWEVGEDKVQVTYTVVGNQFTAEVETPIDNHVLVYYKDNDDRFENPATIIGVNSVSGNLPYEDDENLVIDYSAEYPTTPHGAKIWYIPSSAIMEDNSVDWSQASQFYLESKLIQYNSEGNIILYGNSEIVITPIYTISDYAGGEYEITTTVA